MPERFSRIVNLLLIGECPEERAALRRAFALSPYLAVLDEIGTQEAVGWLSQCFSPVSDRRPDLIIVDLPASHEAVLAGCGLLHQIKARAELRGLPLVLLGQDDVCRSLPSSQEAHRCSIVRKPRDSSALDRLAWHFGEYWGAVARTPTRPDVPKGRKPVPSRPLPVQGSMDEGRPRRPVEILVVDDNNDDAVLFQESLASLEQVHLVEILDDPRAAWDFLCKQGRFRQAATPDLVVLDIHMPQKTGLAFLDEIKAEPSLWMLPVVILTASRLEEDIWESYSRGASSYVEKPPRFERLRELAVRFANYWTAIAYLPNRP